MARESDGVVVRYELNVYIICLRNPRKSVIAQSSVQSGYLFTVTLVPVIYVQMRYCFR